MKNTIVVFLTCLSFVLAINSCQSTHKNSADQYHMIPPELPDSIYNKLQEGDIVLRKGNGPLSQHITNNTHEKYTHCGIIYKNEEKNNWGVIHTLGGQSSKGELDGVQTMDLTEFVSHAADSALYICRPIFTDTAGVKTVERAKYYLDQQVPFDHGFSLLTPDEFYCSELLYYSFKDINQGKNVFIIRKKKRAYILMFSTFFNPENFTKVFNLETDLN